MCISVFLEHERVERKGVLGTLAKLSKGLHLSADGYRLVYQEIMKAIKEEWPDQTPENLLMNFPVWESFSEYYR